MPELRSIGYPPYEKLSYDVSWTGGIKIGELHLTLEQESADPHGHRINAFITTQNGAIHFLYPIYDRHITWVKGVEKLPYRYEIWQEEGHSYQSHKVLSFNQQEGTVITMKNGKNETEYQLGGFANNEFSSFFNSRLMDLAGGSPFVVPTFADKKRVEVVVNVRARQRLDKTILGSVDTLEVLPVLTFKGLYDKKGDTVIWYTDDECRVPVRIQSKIVIGSLTAELRDYENQACQRYQLAQNKQTQ